MSRRRGSSPAGTRGAPAAATPLLRVAFLHPDLGLGGAERLVVDAAAGLRRLGHGVEVFTSHYEPARSFAETRSGAFPVHVHGDWLPRAVLGRLHILCALLRMLWLALRVALRAGAFDVLIVDQVSACVPLLKLLCPRAKVLFYCHYPDQLLAPRASPLLALYRAPFDLLEQATTGLSDGVLVNSRFTLAAFERTFTLLAAGGVRPGVLYPCIDVSEDAPPPPPPDSPHRVLLSINRFERKKEVGTLVTAFAAAIAAAEQQQQQKKQQQQPWHLVLAGGYDPRLAENVEHFEELCALAVRLGLAGKGGLRALAPGSALPGGLLPGFAAGPHVPGSGSGSGSGSATGAAQVLHGQRVTLVRSFSDAQKRALLGGAHALAYTPPREHFGIVPLECMAAARPVLCDASGGPLESVLGGRTGWLCEGGAAGWGRAVAVVLGSSGAELARMGAAGRRHVEASFSRQAFAAALEGHCVALVGGGGGGGGGSAGGSGRGGSRGSAGLRAALWACCAGGVAAAVAAVVLLWWCVASGLLAAALWSQTWYSL